MSENSTHRRLPMPTGQVMWLLFYGVVLWFVAAMILRWIGPMGAYNGSARVLMYALIIPGTVPFLFIVQKLVNFKRSNFALAVAIMGTSAALVDGLVLAWFEWIYGGDVQLIAGAGGTILWGLGVALGLGLWFNRTEN